MRDSGSVKWEDREWREYRRGWFRGTEVPLSARLNGSDGREGVGGQGRVIFKIGHRIPLSGVVLAAVSGGLPLHSGCPTGDIAGVFGVFLV